MTSVDAAAERVLTDVMYAQVIDRFGGPGELHFLDLATPEPGPGQVLIRVAFAGVNPLDYKIRDGSSGLARLITQEDFPLVLGEEASGWVAAIGDGVTGLAVGDAVYGMSGLSHGCYAEYVVMSASTIAPAPAGVALETLGGLAIAGLTAWTAVFDLGKVTADDVVLVHGGGGGVGQVIVQLAVGTGAEVWATASERHREKIEGWGAFFVDYRSQDFTQVVPKPTVIIDGVYFGTYERSIAMLSPGDRLVALPTLADLEPARAAGLEVSVPKVAPSPELLSALAAKVADGSLDLVVSKVLPLAEVAEAHREVEAGHAEGKLVLRVASE